MVGWGCGGEGVGRWRGGEVKRREQRYIRCGHSLIKQIINILLHFKQTYDALLAISPTQKALKAHPFLMDSQSRHFLSTPQKPFFKAATFHQQQKNPNHCKTVFALAEKVRRKSSTFLIRFPQSTTGSIHLNPKASPHDENCTSKQISCNFSRPHTPHKA